MRHAGVALVETVMAQVEDKPRPSPFLPTRLVVRGSTGG